MEIIYFIAGIAITAVFAYFLMKSKSKTTVSVEECNTLKIESERLRSAVTFKDESISELNSKISETNKELRNEFEKSSSLNSKIATLSEVNDNLNKKLAEHSKELEEMQSKFKNEFENLAHKIFEDKSSKFTQQNKENIDQILKPLRESINSFEQKVEQKYTIDVKDRQSIYEQIKNLTDLNNKLSTDANNLTNALKGDSKMQGNWGEMLLETILENSGLVKNKNFSTQVTVKNKEGGILRPDAVINLPANKKIIIDSKVSLTAYARYTASVDEVEKAAALKDHIQSIQNHISELSDKRYFECFPDNSLEFVIMFIPIESAFSLAIKEKPDLYNKAFEKRIGICTVSNLYTTLRLIDTLWKQEIQTNEAMKVAKDCGALYDKFVGFTEDLLKIGKSINDSKKSYDEAFKKLSTGSGNILGRINKINNLKVSDKKFNPVILESAELEDNDDVSDDIIDILPENPENTENTENTGKLFTINNPKTLQN